MLRPQRGGERTGVNGDLRDYRDKMMFRGVRYENEMKSDTAQILLKIFDGGSSASCAQWSNDTVDHTRTEYEIAA
jgi:GMP synthase PP-ATPase subunit